MPLPTFRMTAFPGQWALGVCSPRFHLACPRDAGSHELGRARGRGQLLGALPVRRTGGLCRPDHRLRADLDRDPARLSAKTEIGDRGTPRRPKGVPGLANLGVATACAAFSVFGHNRGLFLLAMAAALSEAAADTVSSELGQAFSEKARLITTWSLVPPGTDGAVSLAGTLAGVIAAGIVSSVCVLGGLMPRSWLAISAGAGRSGHGRGQFSGRLAGETSLG